MKGTQPGARYDEFTIGIFPKVSVDLHLRVLDSHARADIDALLALMSDKDLVKAALAAVDSLFKALDRFLPHIEVIKIWYAWNLNGGSRPTIIARVILVEPGTGKKLEAECGADISCILAKEDLRWATSRPSTIEAAIESLTEGLRMAIKRKVDERREERETLAGDLQEFDLLFQS